MKTRDVALIGGGVVAVGVLLYYFGGKLFAALGGLFSGNNALTAGTPYAGAGVAGTAGAAVNTALGGSPAAAGEAIGSGLYSVLNPNADAGASSVSYIVTFPDGARHAVDSTAVDAGGQFSYAGLRFQMGTVAGKHVATQLGNTGYTTDPQNWGLDPSRMF